MPPHPSTLWIVTIDVSFVLWTYDVFVCRENASFWCPAIVLYGINGPTSGHHSCHVGNAPASWTILECRAKDLSLYLPTMFLLLMGFSLWDSNKILKCFPWVDECMAACQCHRCRPRPHTRKFNAPSMKISPPEQSSYTPSPTWA